MTLSNAKGQELPEMSYAPVFSLADGTFGSAGQRFPGPCKLHFFQAMHIAQ